MTSIPSDLQRNHIEQRDLFRRRVNESRRKKQSIDDKCFNLGFFTQRALSSIRDKNEQKKRARARKIKLKKKQAHHHHHHHLVLSLFEVIHSVNEKEVLGISLMYSSSTNQYVKCSSWN
jgi:hypothetical protein